MTIDHETTPIAPVDDESPVGAGGSAPHRRAWTLVAVTIGVVVVASNSFDRFFLWDEAAFWSQVHDHRGSGAPATTLEASRELGTVLVLRVLAIVSSDLATNRLLWALVTVAVALAVFRAIGRFLGPWAGPLGALLFGTFWVSELFVDSFYANQLGALFQLGAVAAYLAMREEGGDRLVRGVALGALLAASFWMRQLESSLVLAVLLGHSVLRRPALLWRSRLKVVATAGVTLVALFAVPWVVDTLDRFGSVPERLRQARSQEFGRGLGSNAGTYLSTLLGRSIHLRSDAPIWAGVTTLAVVAAVVGLAIVIRRRAPRDSGEDRVRGGEVTGLLVVLSAVTLGFFFFWIEIARDRYLMSGAVFAAAAAGGAIGVAVERSRRLEPRRRQQAAAAFVGLCALWLGSQTAIARHHEDVWDVSTWSQERTAAVVRTLAAGERCAGVARYGQPVIQVGSGCRVFAAADAATARRELERLGGRPGLLFVVWPTKQATDLGLDEDWEHIVQVTERSSLTISYREPHQDG